MFLRRKVYNFFHPKIGEIWCLHRVLPVRSAFKSNRDLEITPEYLEQLVVKKQRQGFRFVDMDAFVAAANGMVHEKKLIHVTFDDGFADVFTQAYPLLKQYSVPFTVYVTTDLPDGKADLWWLQLERLANGSEEWFENKVKQIYGRHENIAATMHAVTLSTVDEDLCRQLSLSWDQIRTMVSEGFCTVGSHGVTHSAFSLMPEEQVKQELINSKRRIEEMVGVNVRHFSYPHSYFNENTNQWVWQTGYDTAVIGYGGATRRKKGLAFFNRIFIVQQ